jgi:hypothetical protein
MRIPPDSNEAFNVALVGVWNPAIFSPSWAKENLSSDPGKEVTMAYPFPLVPMPPRLTIERTNVYPSAQFLMLDCVEYNDDGLVACAERIQRICALLPHTPSTGIGINFRFQATIDESNLLAELLSFSDAGKINSRKYPLQGANIRRTFKLNNQDVLNFSVELISEIVKIDFNFHSDITKLSEAALRATSQKLLERKSEALDFLSSVYGLIID